MSSDEQDIAYEENWRQFFFLYFRIIIMGGSIWKKNIFEGEQDVYKLKEILFLFLNLDEKSLLRKWRY
jgi:hypothetical protein